LYGELMSRIGNKPIDIPAGVKVEKKGLSIQVSGPLGQLQMDSNPRVKVKIEDAEKNNKTVKIEYGDDNVINLTFNSDTEGSA